jgi:type IV pilus assembly protein PilC
MARATRNPDAPATFAYEAISPTGMRIKGPKARMVAYSVDDVRRELLDQGFTPIKIKEINRPGGLSLQMDVGRQGLKLKPVDLATFARSFYQLLNAGISVTRSIEAIGADAANPRLKEICTDIATKINNGTPIATAFSDHPRTFDDVFCGYLAAGEQSGALVASTKRLAELVEKRAQLSTKVRAVAMYPMLVAGLISLIVAGILIFLVPTFAQIYARFHATLPAPTILLISASHHFFPVHFSGYFFDPLSPLLWVSLILGSFTAYKRATKDDPRVGTRLDKIKFRLPLVGKLVKLVVLYRWLSTLSGALESGLRTIPSLELAADASGSRWIKAVTPELTAGLTAGRPLSTLLESHDDLVPSSVRTMIATGEAAGELSSMLDSAVAATSDEIDALVAGLAAKLEVGLIVVLGTTVGLILICLYLPILSLASTISSSTTATTTTTTIPH